MSTRIGIVGGAFNPPHYGHLRPPLEAMAVLNLEAVFFLPTGGHPFKPRAQQAAVEHRVAMTRLILVDQTGFELCELESQRQGTSFTIDTLLELDGRFPMGELFFLPGGDLLAEMHLWKNWQRLIEVAHICPLARPGYETQQAETEAHRFLDHFRVDSPTELDRRRLGRFGFFVLPVTPVAVSSTDLRRRLGRGESIHHLTPDAVIDYIDQHGLYAVPINKNHESTTIDGN